jgi:hypothetical protein
MGSSYAAFATSPQERPHLSLLGGFSADRIVRGGIAAKFGVSLGALEAANPQVSDPNLIFPGQLLTIP